MDIGRCFLFFFLKFCTEGGRGQEGKSQETFLSWQSGPNLYFYFSKSSPPSPSNHLHRPPRCQWLLPNIRVLLWSSGCMTYCFSQFLLLTEPRCTDTKAEESKALGWHWSRIHLQPRRGWHLPLHKTGSSSLGPVRLCTPKKTRFDSCSASIVTHKS